MAIRKFFTQTEVDEVRVKLESLPDLTPQRITSAGVLENIKDTILMLVKEKGYTSADIKSVLDAMEFKFSEKAIAAVISDNGRNKKRHLRRTGNSADQRSTGD